MQKIIPFIKGAAAGTLVTCLYFGVATREDTQGQSTVAPRAKGVTLNPELANGSEVCKPAARAIASEAKPSAASLPEARLAEVEHLIQSFQLQSDNLYNSNEFNDLSYLVRHDKRVGDRVKKQILESSSYDERMSLIAVLAHDDSDDTTDFATSLIEDANTHNQNLGFELLLSRQPGSNTDKLNETLLNAAHYETNPEALGNIINLLSAGNLDEATKARAIGSFQGLLSNSQSTVVTARAIDGISSLGDQDAIYMAVVDHLNHSDPDVKTAAISAIKALAPNKINRDMIETLKHIANNPDETAIAREYAIMVLEDH